MPARSSIDPESALALKSGLPQLRNGVYFLLAPSVLQFFLPQVFYRGTGWLGALLQVIGFGMILSGLHRIQQAAERLSTPPSRSRTKAAAAPLPNATMAPEQAGPLNSLLTPGSLHALPMREDLPIPAASASRTEPTPPAPVRTVPAPMPKDRGPAIDWEAWVGKKLLQKVGILIILIGMAVFLKYSFDNDIIRELGRVVLSLLGACILLGLGEWYRKRYAHWSQAFTGGGLALLYFTVWVAHVLYAEAILEQHGFRIPGGLALLFYSAITVLGAAAAIRHNAQTIGWFAVVGGYLTPVLIPAPELTAALLTGYLYVLTTGVLILSWEKSWRLLTLAAFLLTQLYLFLRVYPLSPETIPDPVHLGIATLFALLFSASLAFAHFRVRAQTNALHVTLAVGNALLTFTGMLPPLGGIWGAHVWILTIVLGGVYLAFGAVALRWRPEDDLLIDVYHLIAIVFLAAALWFKLETAWVAAGLAPFSVLILADAIRIRRPVLLGASATVLALALALLLLQVPVLGLERGQAWVPFRSTWAILSYVCIASLAVWTRLSRTLPPQLLSGTTTLRSVQCILHAAIATVAFLGVTFESNALDLSPTLPLTVGYLLFAAAAGVLFVLLEETVWLIAALLAQALVLLFTFWLSPESTMLAALNGEAIPLFQPWAIASAVSLVIMALLRQGTQRVQDPSLARQPVRAALLIALLGQLWLHGTVEIQHLGATLDWSTRTLQHILSIWWLGLAAALLSWGINRNRHGVLLGGTILIWAAALKDGFHILTGTLEFPSIMAWSVILLGLLCLADRARRTELQTSGMILLPALVAVNAMANATVFAWLHTVWWVLVAGAALGYGVERTNKTVIDTALATVSIAMIHDLQLLPQRSALTELGALAGLFPATMFWTLIGIALTAAGDALKERRARVVGLAMIMALCATDMVTALAQDATLLKTVWWAIAALGTITLGFAQREKLVRSVAIGLFAATVVKLLFFDFAALTTGVRIGASILTGLLLIGASYLYQRFEALVTASGSGNAQEPGH